MDSQYPVMESGITPAAHSRACHDVNEINAVVKVTQELVDGALMIVQCPVCNALRTSSLVD